MPNPPQVADSTPGRKPRRRAGEGGISLRKDHRWQVTYPVPGGRPIYKYARTEAEAERILAQLRAGTFNAGGSTKLAAFADEWLADIERQVRAGERAPGTWRAYRTRLDRHILPYLGNRPLDALSVREVDAWQVRLAKDGRSAHTRRTALVTLRTLLTEAERQEVLTRNVARLTRPPRVEGREVAPFTPAEARDLLTAARTFRHELAVVLGLRLGLRLGEILGLRWADIDWERPRLTVKRQMRIVAPQMGDTPREVAKTKTRASRTVALPSDVLAALKRHRANGRRISEWIMAGPSGDPLAHVSVEHAWNRWRRGYEREHPQYPPRRLHDLRHGWSTLAHLAGVSEKSRMTQLGHSQPATTRLYTEVGIEVLEDAAERVRRLLEVGDGRVN